MAHVAQMSTTPNSSTSRSRRKPSPAEGYLLLCQSIRRVRVRAPIQPSDLVVASAIRNTRSSALLSSNPV